jgi:hypothetical protein
MTTKLPEHISYSSYNTWLECGWKYKLTKMEDVPEKHAVWFTGGSAVHKATEYWDISRSSNNFSEDLDTIWNNAWFAQVKEDEALHGDMKDWEFRSREDMSWWYGEGWWMLERWVKFREGGWSVYEDYIEKQFVIPIGSTQVKMAIDRVMVDYDGNKVLVDIKTGASSQRHPLQLAIYAWALQKNGVSIDKAGFWDARTGHISTWNLEHLSADRVEDMFLTFDKARKADIFLPNLNSCGRCGVISYCKWLNGNKTKEGK